MTNGTECIFSYEDDYCVPQALQAIISDAVMNGHLIMIVPDDLQDLNVLCTVKVTKTSGFKGHDRRQHPRKVG